MDGSVETSSSTVGDSVLPGGRVVGRLGAIGAGRCGIAGVDAGGTEPLLLNTN